MMENIVKALEDPIRREILVMLRDHSMNADEMAKAFTIGNARMAHHLELLAQANLVIVVKEGQPSTYALQASAVEEAIARVLELKLKKSVKK